MTAVVLELIERLEKATGPDRELDLAINLAVDPDSDISRLMQHRRGFDGKEGMAWDIHQGAVCFEQRNAVGRCHYNGGYPLPAYTGSIDAALKLVPEGLAWRVDVMTGLPGAIVAVHNSWLSHKTAPCCWTGKTPAMALCIAALKARNAS